MINLETLRVLSSRATMGKWEARQFSYDDGIKGPDYFLTTGASNLSSDMDEDDAKFAAEAINYVRQELARTDPRSLEQALFGTPPEGDFPASLSTKRGAA